MSTVERVAVEVVTTPARPVLVTIGSTTVRGTVTGYALVMEDGEATEVARVTLPGIGTRLLPSWHVSETHPGK